MKQTAPVNIPMPGLDVVGRGIFLKSRQPYELKKRLFSYQQQTEHYACETGQTYLLPHGYHVNDSPPMPSGIALNRVVIEESMERLDKKLNVDSQVSCSYVAFSVDASAGQTSMMQCNDNAYYATRTSFIPFWTLYVGDSKDLSEDVFDLDIPVPFKHEHRRLYEQFFNRFGSHYVKRVWVGGRANLTFSVLKSADISEQQIRSGIKASFGGMASAGQNSQMMTDKQNLLNNSQCSVSGKGGDTIKLAELNTLNESAYNLWMSTIKDNPQAIELEVAGIWTLLADQAQATALQAAYQEATAFVPISSIFCINSDVYFIRDRDYFTYNSQSKKSHKPQPLEQKWPQLSEIGFHRIDAALCGDYLGFKQQNRLTNKVFLFHRSSYVTLNLADKCFSEPVDIKSGWPGVPFDHIDAALHFEPDNVYFFNGQHYVRFNINENKVDDAYPALISERWVGVNFDSIDAAIYWGNGKVYFFREDQYIRYDVVNYCADPGYPKFILGNYVEDWKLFV